VGHQPGSKDLAIPRSHHDAAAIAGELVGEILSRPQAADPGPSSARRPLDRNDLMFVVCSIRIRRLGQAISRHGRDIGYRGRGVR
jgi:hypothetical protein